MKTAIVHETIAREGEGSVPLSPWSRTCLPVNFHCEEQSEATSTFYKRPKIQPLKPHRAELTMKYTRSRPKGWLGKADVLDDLPKGAYKKTTVNSTCCQPFLSRRYISICSAARNNLVVVFMSTRTVVCLVSSLPSLFYTMTSHRDIYIYKMSMLKE
jgi:hypothetical protein